MNKPIDLIDQVPNAYKVLSPAEQPYFYPSLTIKDTDPTFPLSFRIASQAIINLAATLNRAQQATELARSHRDYRVGAVAVMYNLDEAIMAVLKGYNIKPDKGSGGDNFHAEQIAIAKGRSLGLDNLAAISVIADPDDEDANPRNLPTLPPCTRCVGMFKEEPEVTPTTTVLGSNLDLKVCELYDVAHLYNPYDAAHNPSGVRKLVERTFSLATLQDMDTFDHDIAPYVIDRMLSSFQRT